MTTTKQVTADRNACHLHAEVGVAARAARPAITTLSAEPSNGSTTSSRAERTLASGLRCHLGQQLSLRDLLPGPYRDARDDTARGRADRVQAGIDATQISRYERGSILPGAETVTEIARVLHVSLDTLLQGKAYHAADSLPIRNVILLERFREIEELSRRDQEILLELIDSVLARRRMQSSGLPRRRTA
jgi:transcriptional regulator with XRE-family HTH domain